MKSPFCILLCGVCLVASSPQAWARKKSPAPTPPPTPTVEPAPKPERRFFGLLPAKEETPPPAPPPAVTKKKSSPPTKAKSAAQNVPPAPEPKKSSGFLGLFKREKPEPTPVPPTPVKPEKKSASAPKTPPPVVAEEKKSGGFLGLFKRKPEADPAPAPAEKARPTQEVAKAQEKKPGFFSRIFGGNSKEDSEAADALATDPSDRPQRPANWQEKYIVIEDDVAAYAYGPSQSRDPEDRLPKGMIVSVKRNGKFWSEITTPSGRNFTIGADQIRKARESDFAPPPVIASSLPSGEIIPMPEFDPSPPTNLPETTPQRNLDLPDLLLPPLPPR